MRLPLAAVLMVAVLVPSAALAGKPAHAGKGKHKEKDKTVVVKEQKDGDRIVVFTDRDRDSVRTWWRESYGAGNCPPGLAKKNNGCLPPGIAKKRYVVGRPLPASIVIQELPPVLVTRIGAAPAGYQYAIVDGDIVKLAVGTRLVVDAIDALLR